MPPRVLHPWRHVIGFTDYSLSPTNIRFQLKVESPPFAVILAASSAMPLTPMNPSADGVITPNTWAVFNPSIESAPWSGVLIATHCVLVSVVCSQWID
jgi:hypothetical protein